MKKVITFITVLLLLCSFSLFSVAYDYHDFDLSYDYFSSDEKIIALENGIEETALYKIGFQDGYHYTFEHYKDENYDYYSSDYYGRSYDDIHSYFKEGKYCGGDSTGLQLSMLYSDAYAEGRISAEKELGIYKTYDDGWEDGYEQAKEEYSVPDEEENERKESKWSIGSIVATCIVGGILIFFIGGWIFSTISEKIKAKKENKKS